MTHPFWRKSYLWIFKIQSSGNCNLLKIKSLLSSIIISLIHILNDFKLKQNLYYIKLLNSRDYYTRYLNSLFDLYRWTGYRFVTYVSQIPIDESICCFSSENWNIIIDWLTESGIQQPPAWSLKGIQTETEWEIPFSRLCIPSLVNFIV